MAVKRKTKRTRRTGRRTYGKRYTKRLSHGGNYAKLVETVEQPLYIENGDNAVWSLSDFQRAQEVAHAYKYYRLAKVEVDFIPFANVSQFTGTASARLPQLYKHVDRVANMAIGPTLNEMLERGIRPIIFKRMCTMKFKPNLLQNVQFEVNNPIDAQGDSRGIPSIGALNSTPVFNKWLPTQQSFGYKATPPPPSPGTQQHGQTLVQPAVNPYTLNYYGLTYFVQQDGSSPDPPVQCGDIQFRLTWEFKGARALCQEQPASFLPASPETSTQVVGVYANTQPTDYGCTGPTGSNN